MTSETSQVIVVVLYDAVMFGTGTKQLAGAVFPIVHCSSQTQWGILHGLREMFERCLMEIGDEGARRGMGDADVGPVCSSEHITHITQHAAQRLCPPDRHPWLTPLRGTIYCGNHSLRRKEGGGEVVSQQTWENSQEFVMFLKNTVALNKPPGKIMHQNKCAEMSPQCL